MKKLRPKAGDFLLIVYFCMGKVQAEYLLYFVFGGKSTIFF